MQDFAKINNKKRTTSYEYLIFDEQYLFKDLLLSDTCKKKNGTINLYEI